MHGRHLCPLHLMSTKDYYTTSSNLIRDLRRTAKNLFLDNSTRTPKSMVIFRNSACSKTIDSLVCPQPTSFTCVLIEIRLVLAFKYLLNKSKTFDRSRDTEMHQVKLAEPRAGRFDNNRLNRCSVYQSMTVLFSKHVASLNVKIFRSMFNFMLFRTTKILPFSFTVS